MKASAKSNDLTLSELYEELVIPVLEGAAAHDPRRKNAKHTALDALKMGFAVFHLKAPSLNAFRPRLETEDHNLKSVFNINELPSDNGLRNILDVLPSSPLNEGFRTVLPFLEKRGKLTDYHCWNGHLVCSIDGVVHQCSNKVRCDCCLEKKHRNGTVSYSHAMLTAAVVCHGKREVFVVNNEPIIKRDGQCKNDCERNAAGRLFKRMPAVFGSQPVVYVMDALYACAPLIKQIGELEGPSNKYVINAKDKGNKHLFNQFDALNEGGQIRWRKYTNKEGTFRFGYANDLELNASNPEVKTNFLYCRFKPRKGEEIVFSWVTNITLDAESVVAVMRMGRSRWKVENEVFNTLKNQEYNYGHNFGHGRQHLATNFAYLMMLAFTVDQLRQCCSRSFGRVHKKLKTLVKVWDVCRAVFKMVTCKDMADFERNLLLTCGLRTASG
jgi:hypothetical protein